MKIITTKDGSHTLYVEELDETYHSTFGALQESRHIFINAGLHEMLKQKQDIKILEIGFGTGLNAILTVIEAERLNFTCFYHGLEPFPLDMEIVSGLNYDDWMNEETKDVFRMIHKQEYWKVVMVGDDIYPEQKVGKNFYLLKSKDKIQDIEFREKYDLVYFDGFAPDKQPEVWTEEVFRKIHDAMNPGGILVTYSAKGEVKRNLRAVGFEVKRLAGPEGKKHILRAIKSITN